MMLAIFLFLSKLVRAKGKTRFAFLDKVVRPYLELAILAGTLLTMAYVAETMSVLALEFPQNLFELIP